MDSENTFDQAMMLDQTIHIVAAYVSNNRVAEADLPALISSVFAALTSTTTAAQAVPEPEPLVPAVPVKKSVTDDYITCLEDGKKFKSLKRHLMTHYDLTPDAYRAKWKLPADYPMVAPNYAAARSALAKTMGLGRKPGERTAAEPAQKAPKARASRKQQEAAE
ncbi:MULTISPECIES: MucR family transcriptional regulator [unclassified Aureimonas]|uniref:MucR family transcriptional regulator n=1 Tax=unclassified Aureimonas TaxID=2615206 RepID=UPI0006F48B6E|nr:MULTISPECIES: MucR family transcriptional regulator [unclassified Aureimonas]KQT64026.1 MucR family transcriptional regulator [Aureimonas sp. Leaf427]KQT81219.1 MucR family transcriptional regulator [Aureimonas sp. Leaf460]